MSSIDERVVSMKFDNDQFQQGIQQTTNSLDNLKKGLNLDGAKESLNGLNEAGKNFSLKGIADGVDTIASKFNAFGAIGFSVINNLTNSVMNFGSNMLNSLLGPLIQGGEQRALAIEQAKFQFEGLGMDVQASMNSALDAVKGTAFGLDAAAKIAAQFGASGIQAGDQMTSALKGVAGIAAMTGSSFEDIGNIFASVAGNGRLMGSDLFQFSARGINVAAALAKQMGTTEEKVRSMVTKGKIDFKTFYTAMDEAFGAHAKDADKTFEGAVDNMKAALSRIGADFATPRFEGLRVIFNALTPVIDGVHKALTPLVDMFAKLSEFSSDRISKFLESFNNFQVAVLLPPLIQVLVNLLTSAKVIAEQLGAAFREVFPPAEHLQLLNIVDGLRDFSQKLIMGEKTASELKSTFKGVFAIFDIGFTIIWKLLGVFAGLFGQVAKGSGGILAFTGHIGDWLVSVDKAMKKGDGLNNFFAGLAKVLSYPIEAIKVLARILGGIGLILGAVFDGFITASQHGVPAALDRIKSRLDPFSSLGHTLSDIWTGFKNILKNVLDFFAPAVREIRAVLDKISGAVAESIRKMDFQPLMDLFNTGFLAFLALMLSRLKIWGLKFSVAGSPIGALKLGLLNLTVALKGMQAQLNAATLEKLAIAIALMAAAIVAMSLVDSAKLTAAIAGMGAMVSELLIAFNIISKINMSGGMFKLPFIVGALIGLAIAIDILVIAVKALSKLDWVALAKGLSAVTILLMDMSVAAKIIGPNVGNLIGVGIGMIGIAIAIDILANAVKKFSELDWVALSKGMAAVTTIMIELAIFTKVTSGAKSMISVGISMLIIAEALKILASAVGDFAKFSWEELGKGAAAFGGSLLIIALALKLMPKDSLGMAVALVVVGAALKIVASALKDMGGMSWEEIGKGLLTLGTSLLMLGLALMLMEEALPGAAALLVAAFALTILVKPLKELGDMSWDEIGKGLLMLGTSLLILGLAMMIFESAIPGAFAMIVVAGAIAILAPALALLGSMSWDDIGRGLAMLASSLGILAVAGIIILPAIPGLMLLGVAVLLLGVGTLAAGLGLLAFSAGLVALTAAGGAAMTVLIPAIQGILGLIPYAFQQVALGLIAFAQILSAAAPVFIQAMTTLMTSLLTAINNVAPLIITTLVNLIWLLVKTIRDNLPNFIQAGWDILIAFLKGIANNMPQVVDTAIDIVVSFLNSIRGNVWRLASAAGDVIIAFVQAVGTESWRVANAAGDTLVTFVNNLASSVETHAGPLRAAGGRLAAAIVDGMTGGLSSRVGDIINSAANLGDQAVAAIQRALNINSPSRRTRKLGNYAGLGLAMGMDDSHDLVNDSAQNLGNKAVDSLSKALSSANAQAAMSIDSQPVIRPVLDLSAIKKDATLIGGMITPPALAVQSSFDKASYISAVTAANQNVPSTPSNTGTSAAGNSVTFIQNNTSPKALTNAEIYRQTNNQLSVLQKGASVGANA